MGTKESVFQEEREEESEDISHVNDSSDEEANYESTSGKRRRELMMRSQKQISPDSFSQLYEIDESSRRRYSKYDLYKVKKDGQYYTA